MRIAFFVWKFPKLSETFIVNQLTGLLDHGHDVRIVTAQWGDLRHMHQDVIDYNLVSRTICTPSLPRRRTMRLLKGAGLLLTAGWRTPRRMAGVIAQTSGRERARRLYEAGMLWGQRFDVIHAQFGGQGLRALRSRDAGVIAGPIITHFRGYDVSAFVRAMGQHVYAPLFERGDFFLVNCDFFRQRVLELGCPPDRLLVQRSGIDVEAFPFRQRNGPRGEVFHLLTVGRLTGKKGIEYALRACALLVSQGCKLRYDIIGQGALRPRLESLICELGLGSYVRLLGGATQEQIRAALDAADLFIAPSVTGPDGDQDAPVNVLKEAMACGMPVVATRHGGIPELVEDGISGWLVPERDSDRLADRLENLMRHPAAWAAMGQAGRQRVVRDYDIRVLNRRLIGIYESVIAGKVPAADYSANGERVAPLAAAMA